MIKVKILTQPTIFGRALKIKNSIGSSLVELIVYMGMFSILLIMLLQMFTTILNAQLESQATSSVALDGRYILSRLTYDIQEATNIATPSSFGISGTTLRVTGNNRDFSYTINNNVLNLTNNSTGTTDSLNSIDTSISNLSFTKIGTSSSSDNSVQISFTLTSNTIKSTGKEIKSFQTTVGTR